MRYDRLPEHLRPNLPECQRLTRVVACIDRKLRCVWNGQTQRYELWGPSREFGWAFISAVEKDGAPMHPDCYPVLMLATLRARDQPLNMKAIAERNAQRVEREWQATMDEAGEAAKYVAAAVAQEAIGAARHGSQDVMDGLRFAYEGRSRAPARSRGQIISLPGR
jgi:hypothetical protein